MYENVYGLCTDPDSILVGIDGVSDKLSSVISSFIAGYHYEEVSTWAQLKESYNDMLDYYIADRRLMRLIRRETSLTSSS